MMASQQTIDGNTERRADRVAGALGDELARNRAEMRRKDWLEARERLPAAKRLERAGLLDHARACWDRGDRRRTLRAAAERRSSLVWASAPRARTGVEAIELSERRRIRDAISDALDRCGYRRAKTRWAGGDHDTVVSILGSPWRRDPARLAGAAAGDSSRVWSDNGKWSGRDSRHLIDVRLLYLRRVPEEIRVVGGLLVLDAIPIDEGLLGGERAWRALVVRQSRGFDLRAEEAVVLLIGGWAVVAKTLCAARRKIVS